jgi:hypothetical protein
MPPAANIDGIQHFIREMFEDLDVASRVEKPKVTHNRSSINFCVPYLTLMDLDKIRGEITRTIPDHTCSILIDSCVTSVHKSAVVVTVSVVPSTRRGFSID